MTILISILYVYITIFTIYFIILTTTGITNNKKHRDKYTPKDSNLCVVIYASGVVNTLENLIQQLKNQNYFKRRYSIYVILDKCENVDETSLQSDLDVKVISINNMEPIGKSQAFSIIAERFNEVENLDAFVFLNANYYVDSDFLANVNFYLSQYDVLVPMINYMPNETKYTLVENIKATYYRYYSKFLCATRSKMGLANLINTNAFVIKKQILIDMENFEFQDKTAEILYTMKLLSKNIVPSFVKDLNVYTNISNYDSRIPSLSKRFSIFSENITKPLNFKTKEYLCSLIAPNCIITFFIYYILLSHTYIFPFWVSYMVIFFTLLTLLLFLLCSLLVTNFYLKEYIYLALYPIYSIAHVVKNLPPIRGIINFIKNKNRKRNIEKMVTNVIVTDGTQEFQCQLELISDDGLAKVKFINKNKVYSTKQNHLRMTDAIKELSNKLNEYGLSLKICQNCKYFQPIVDGTTSMIKGCCNCKFQGRIEGDILPTLVWNTCPKFETINIVNLF